MLAEPAPRPPKASSILARPAVVKLGTSRSMEADFVSLRTRLYSDEGPRFGAVADAWPSIAAALAVWLIRWN